MKELGKLPDDRTKYVVVEDNQKRRHMMALSVLSKRSRLVPAGQKYNEKFTILGYSNTMSLALNHIGNWVPKLYYPT